MLSAEYHPLIDSAILRKKKFPFLGSGEFQYIFNVAYLTSQMY